MENQQDLFSITTGALNGLKGVLKAERPDLVIVHGDTTTTLAASLAAFYMRIPVANEAGLYPQQILAYPEEMNRTLTGRLG